MGWKCAFLSNRSFRVRVDGQLSAPRPATSGVPQGGSLSPIRYVILVLDLPEYLPPSLRAFLYADDLKIYGPARYPQDLLTLRAGIDGVERWCRDNFMTLSTSKCAVLTSRTPRPRPPVVEFVTDLGITVTADLNFDEHIRSTVTSAKILVNSIFRCFIVRQPEFCIRLFQSLVVSKFLYCGPVWLPYKAKNIKSIEAVRSHFIKRLSLRCDVQDIPYEVSPPIMSTLSEQELRILRRLILQNDTSHYLEVKSNCLRSRNSIRTKAIANTELINNVFAWRVCFKISNGEISADLFTPRPPFE